MQVLPGEVYFTGKGIFPCVSSSQVYRLDARIHSCFELLCNSYQNSQREAV